MNAPSSGSITELVRIGRKMVKLADEYRFGRREFPAPGSGQ
jgi:hypothetical protein